MVYQFKKKNKLDRQALKIIAQQAQYAFDQLNYFEDDPAARVHRARQCFKRIRSLLKLLRADSPYFYAVENHCFRMIAKSLSGKRDRDVIVKTVNILAKANINGSGAESALLLRRQIMDYCRDRDADAALHNQQSIFDAIASLQAALDRYKRLKLSGIKRRKLKAAIEKSASKMKQAYRHACVSDSAEVLHNWRKAVKRLHNQLQLCSVLKFGYSRHYQEQLAFIGNLLGEHRDVSLVIMVLKDSRDPLAVDHGYRQAVEFLSRCQHDLRKRAAKMMHDLLRGHVEPAVVTHMPAKTPHAL